MTGDRTPPDGPLDPPDGSAETDGRPLVERLGLGVIAVVIAAVFALVAVAAFASGEIFLGAMAGIGALMTLWAAAATLLRG